MSVSKTGIRPSRHSHPPRPRCLLAPLTLVFSFAACTTDSGYKDLQARLQTLQNENKSLKTELNYKKEMPPPSVFPGHREEDLDRILANYEQDHLKRSRGFLISFPNTFFGSSGIALGLVLQKAVLRHLQSKEGFWPNDLRSEFGAVFETQKNIRGVQPRFSDEDWFRLEAFYHATIIDLDFIYPPNVVWGNTDQQLKVFRFVHTLHTRLLNEEG